MNVLEVNVLVLAYLGDTIYEDYIRRYLINKGINNVNELQSESLKYVSAKGQSNYLEMMLEDEFFSQEELDVIKRARNNTNKTHPKNTDIITYKRATGLEALIGYLDLTNNKERIEEIMNYILER
ncbi:MAG: Mini-ribonuclease 3 [Bacilli bacterium]|nr:Mini-ribonuclease 3 [Bacilli bacterium]MBQ6539033.1 Mini-ribonuclease 3 [Bacilli bacterium]